MNPKVDESQRKDTRKSAKKIIKLAKEHPKWYTKEEVRFAKLIRKSLKKNKNAKGEIDISNSQSGGDDGLRGESQQPEESRQPKRGWFAEILHKASTLVGL